MQSVRHFQILPPNSDGPLVAKFLITCDLLYRRAADMLEFSYVAISLTGILLWVLHGLQLSCHLCLVFEVMVYLTRLDAEIGLLELYGMC